MSEVSFKASSELNDQVDQESKKRKEEQERDIKAARVALEKAREAARIANKAKREAAKTLAKEKNRGQLDQEIAIWRKITAVIESANNEIADIISSENDLKSITLKKVKIKPDYGLAYTYQHPGRGKQSLIKGNDENADWIKEYTKGGGNIASLIEQANKTIEKAFIANFKRKKRSDSKDSGTKTKSNKSKSTTTSSGIDKNSPVT